MYWGCSWCQMQDKRYHEQVRFKCIKRKRPTHSISFAVSFVCLPGCSMWFSLHSACKERERISPWPGLYFLLLGLGCEQMKGVLHSGKTSPWEKKMTWPNQPIPHTWACHPAGKSSRTPHRIKSHPFLDVSCTATVKHRASPHSKRKVRSNLHQQQTAVFMPGLLKSPKRLGFSSAIDHIMQWVLDQHGQTSVKSVPNYA